MNNCKLDSKGIYFNASQNSNMEIFYRGLYCNYGQSVQELIDENKNRCKLNYSNQYLSEKMEQHNLTVTEVIELAKNSKERWESEAKPIFITTDTVYAENYATEGANHTGVVLKYRLDKKKIRVDGRDFLYSIYLYELSDNDLEVLKRCYGKKIIEYYKGLKQLKGCSCDKIFTYLDYITFDTEIINAHIKSNTIIGGRYGRNFKNSFIYYDKILESDIVDIIQYKQGIPISHNRNDAEIDIIKLPRH